MQGLYEYDAVDRLRDGQLGEAQVHDVTNYIRPGTLWQAFTAPVRVVLLLDEIDKAYIEFPNDLLQELDRMEFYVYETGQTVRAIYRPVVIITSLGRLKWRPFFPDCWHGLTPAAIRRARGPRPTRPTSG